jgi:hypothetical protein
MQERIRRLSTEDFPRADEFRQMQREGRLIDPKIAARVVAYLGLPATQRNGEALRFDEPDLTRAAEDALTA